MDEMDFISILDDMTDEEFNNFKWHLKRESITDIPPLKVNQLSKADRREVVDLMMQKFELEGTMQVMERVLKKMSRNDLVKKLHAVAAETGGPGPAATVSGSAQVVQAEAKLASIRSNFVDKISDPVLRKLLDKLLEQRVIIDDEMEDAGTFSRADKARKVIDTVRKKGSRASSALIVALREVDPCLSEELGLM